MDTRLQTSLFDKKTCEKFGKYFPYYVGEAEQSAKDNPAFNLIIPTSEESRLVVVQLDE